MRFRLAVGVHPGVAEGLVRVTHAPLPKLPVERLLAFAGCGTEQLAERLGLGHGAARNALKRGGLTAATADRWAVALGYHPAEIWGDDWWAIPVRVCDNGHLWEGNRTKGGDCRVCKSEAKHAKEAA